MSVTVRLLLLMALGILPALLVGAYAEYATRQAQEAEVRREAVRLADQVGTEMRQIMEGVRTVAAALAQVPTVVSAASEGERWSENCAAVVTQIRRQQRNALAIGVAGMDGALVCADSAVPLDITIRGDHVNRALETGRFVVGGYGEGLGGEAYLTFAHPLAEDGGSAVGALVFGLRLDWLREHMRERYAGTDSSVAIADRNLVYLVRIPEGQDPAVGQPALPEHREYAALADQGAVEGRGRDGVVRVGAITSVTIDAIPTNGFDLLVGFGVSRDAAFAPIDRGKRDTIVLFGLSFLFAMLAALIGGRILVRRPVDRLLSAARRWSAGDLSERVPQRIAGAEFEELSKAFNAMAESIEHRTRQLEASEKRFRTLASLVPAFIWFTDADGKPLYINERWYAFTGQEHEGEAPAHWADAIHPEDAERTWTAWRDAVTARTPFEAEFRVRRRDGTDHWVLGLAEPLRDENGEVVQWFGAAADIDRLKRADEHRSLLIDELNHRVKNTLATVQALAAQSLRDDAGEGRKSFEARLIALSKAHDVLTRGYWKSAGLRDVVQEATSPFASDDGTRIRLDGPEVELSPRQALSLSMALHELLTNAAKYGALSNPEGTVSISWSIRPGTNLLRLNWEEKDGPPVQAPVTSGFGTRLITSGVARELGGTTDLRLVATGVVCTLEFPREAVGLARAQSPHLEPARHA